MGRIGTLRTLELQRANLERIKKQKGKKFSNLTALREETAKEDTTTATLTQYQTRPLQLVDTTTSTTSTSATSDTSKTDSGITLLDSSTIAKAESETMAKGDPTVVISDLDVILSPTSTDVLQEAIKPVLGGGGGGIASLGSRDKGKNAAAEAAAIAAAKRKRRIKLVAFGLLSALAIYQITKKK